MFKNKNRLIAIIITFSGTVLALVFDNLILHFINWKSLKEGIVNFFLFKLNIYFYQLILFGIFLVLFSLLCKKFLKNESVYSRKQKKIQKFNKLDIPEEQIQFKWDVYFSRNGKPKISNLTLLCTKHDIPTICSKRYGARFLGAEWYKCLEPGCKTEMFPDNLEQAENRIESLVNFEWERIT